MRLLPAVRVGAGTVLLPARAWEQGLLGLATLVLASRLDFDTFAAASVLLLANTLAVTIGDWGVGLAVLRLGPGVHASRRSLDAVRRGNLSVCVAAAVTGSVLGGRTGVVLIAAGVIWLLAAESHIRKSSALRLRRHGEVAFAELIGSSVFIAVVLVAGRPAWAVAATGGALAAKHAVEIVLVRSWSALFEDGAPVDRAGRGWLSQVLSFATANVDYLAVGTLLGPAAFAVYVLGYRAANALPAQLSSVATRLSLVDLAGASSTAARQQTYDRALRRLLAAGVAGAILTTTLSPLLPLVLGDRWRGAVAVTVVLALAIPWRLTLGLAGAVALAGGAAGQLVRWEVARLAVTALALAASALAGFPAFVVVAAATQVVATAVEHTLACRATGLVPARGLRRLAAATVGLILLAGVVLL